MEVDIISFYIKEAVCIWQTKTNQNSYFNRNYFDLWRNNWSAEHMQTI